MRVVIFCHSLLSDWNHGNAHFLRGIVTELAARGHHVDVYEPEDAWSVVNLVRDHGLHPLRQVRVAYPAVRPVRYPRHSLDLAAELHGADVVLVHEWSDPELVAAVGGLRGRGAPFSLFFHDTHHRSVTAPHEIAAYDLRWYDGVLAFGDPIRDAYLHHEWAARAWTWHEAADTRVFAPRPFDVLDGDLVWIGNWGDGERAAELREFLIEPVRRLGLRATVYGVRYPPEALAVLREAGIEYGGYLPNHAVPGVFARHRVTVHVPRRPYVRRLPGIPTIRPFEALACGIPLVCALWDTAEPLFTPGRDFLIARDGAEMTDGIERVLTDEGLAASLAAHGRNTILARHTCGHRVDELLAIVAEIRERQRVPAPSPRLAFAWIGREAR